MIEKQKLRFYYSVLEKQIVGYITKRRITKDFRRFLLFQILESRLDNIIYRLGWVLTIYKARQLITHENILVDKQKICRASFFCDRDKEIRIRNFQIRLIIEINIRKNKKKLPSYLLRNIQNIIACVNKLIMLDNLLLQLKEYYILEYYSNRILSIHILDPYQLFNIVELK